MVAVASSPFFLLFVVTSGVASFLAHRLFVLRHPPSQADRYLALVCAGLSIALSVVTYLIRAGAYCPAAVNPDAASIVSGVTGIGVAVVCFKCVLPAEETTDRVE